jgi:hypothetical protein
MNSNNNLAQRCHAALNRLTKWKAVFAGWQLGTRPLGDPECDAVRDHREVTILNRAEISTLIGLCVKNGVFTEEDFQRALIDEAEQLSKDYERKFPGMKATDIGMQYDKRAADTMKDWKP